MESLSEIYERNIRYRVSLVDKCDLCGSEFESGKSIRFSNRTTPEKVCIDCFNDKDYQDILKRSNILSITKLKKEEDEN